MRKVWKYPVPLTDRFSVDLPMDAEVLAVQESVLPQSDIWDSLVMWALLNPDAPKERRTFRLAGTGHPIVDDGDYIGTTQLRNGLVFHLFEVAE